MEPDHVKLRRRSPSTSLPHRGQDSLLSADFVFDAPGCTVVSMKSLPFLRRFRSVRQEVPAHAQGSASPHGLLEAGHPLGPQQRLILAVHNHGQLALLQNARSLLCRQANRQARKEAVDLRIQDCPEAQRLQGKQTSQPSSPIHSNAKR